MDLHVSSRTHTYSSRFTINRGNYWGGYTSHFGCAEIIMINNELPFSEIECIENI